MRSTWAEAMAAGLHGPDGFYRRGRGPDLDFRTAATVAPDLLADALAALLRRLPPTVAQEVVEVGAGTGGLLSALAARVPPGVRLVGIEQRPRPGGLPPEVEWRSELPESVRGILVAFEWLDTVPVDVVEHGRLLEVDADGHESPGPAPGLGDAAWAARWWPSGRRREIGHRRDDAWADAVGRISAGLGVAVDYGHETDSRPDGGTLTGYRDGRQVPAVPDPDTDVTAAVAWDAVLHAVATLCPGAEESRLLPQHVVLRDLGVTAELPARAVTDAASLRRANHGRLLLDPAGLGGFGWAVSVVGVDLPLAAAF